MERRKRWMEREKEREREERGRKRVEGRRGHRGRRNKFKRKYFSAGRPVKIPVYIFSRIKDRVWSYRDWIYSDWTGCPRPGLYPPYGQLYAVPLDREGERGEKVRSLPSSNCSLFDSVYSLTVFAEVTKDQRVVCTATYAPITYPSCQCFARFKIYIFLLSAVIYLDIS